MRTGIKGLAALCCCSAFLVSVNGDETTPKITGEKLAEIMQMDLDEIKLRTVALFELIDTNADGVIDESEAKAWSSKLKDAMHKHQVALEFQSIDKNSDGKIALEELQMTYSDGVEGAQAEVHKAEVRKRFDAVDKDKDGTLSLEEVTLLMDPGKDAALMQIEVDEIMGAQDKDKDGFISIEEFLSTEGGTLTAQEKEELTKEFSNYDTNKDSKIDVDELKEIIRDPHAHELQVMMESFVKDMVDGKIAKDHWAENFQTYSVSMLTDNGELLRFPEDYSELSLPFKGIIPKTQPEEGKHEEL